MIARENAESGPECGRGFAGFRFVLTNSAAKTAAPRIFVRQLREELDERDSHGAGRRQTLRGDDSRAAGAVRGLVAGEGGSGRPISVQGRTICDSGRGS